MMDEEELEIGYTACYINDYEFKHLTDIPVCAAVEWAKNIAPNSNMGNAKAKDLTVGGDENTDANENGWENKLFIIVGYEHGKFIAINNQDRVFSIRVQT